MTIAEVKAQLESMAAELGENTEVVLAVGDEYCPVLNVYPLGLKDATEAFMGAVLEAGEAEFQRQRQLGQTSKD